MEVEINWLAVLLATASTMVVGTIWYAPSVFGNMWMKLVKLDKKDIEGGSAKPIAISVLVSLVTAYVLAHFTYIASVFYVDYSFMEVALSTAFWLWLGIIAARVLTHDLFEQRPTKLTALTVGHELVVLVVMALIIGALQP